MPDLISKADAYEHLRLDYDSDGSADDGWLDIFIPAISEAIALWLKDEWRLYVVEVDSEGDVVLDSDDVPVIRTIERVSRPGRRVYASVKNIPSVANGLGVSILSTPKGVMADHEAKSQNLGGEVLCRVF